MWHRIKDRHRYPLVQAIDVTSDLREGTFYSVGHQKRDFVFHFLPQGFFVMGDHLVLYVDRLVKPVAVQSVQEAEAGAKIPSDMAGSSCSAAAADDNVVVMESGVLDEKEPLINMAECRICQEEDSIKDLETPCACSGSLKYAHRKCVQHWCNEKGDIICEICHKPYQPGYTAPPPPAGSEETAIDIGGGWTISGTPLDLHDPRLLAMADAERHFLEAEYDEYAATNASGAAFCRSVASNFNGSSALAACIDHDRC
ncbi:hypothetical protein F0562_032906 [Nyssa sinensis]|uniref:RING-CH-type domain-containing protein n=1 Tax=Nyssa sinensis TaxID=561372 RepID=A0A5J5AU75_9ASTE|nr:hypothetical protein F0562_032906 [Nyssa sinensis]